MSLFPRPKSTPSSTKKPAAIFKITIPEVQESPAKKAPEAIPEPASSTPAQDDAASTEEAIRLATRSAKTDELEKKGINNIRLLSESKLQDLIVQMVEAKVQKRLSSDTAASHSSSLGADADLRLRLRQEYEKKWQEFQGQQEAKLRGIEERVARVNQTFTAMEQSMEFLTQQPPPS